MKNELRYITLETFRKFEDEMNAKLEEIYACIWQQIEFNNNQLAFNSKQQEINDLNRESHQDHHQQNRKDHKKLHL